MRLTAFFKLYKICILLHRCNLKIFAKNRFEKTAIFVKISKNLQMLQNLQNVARFQKFQLDNLVDFEKCCKTRIFLQKSVPIQPKTSNILPKFCRSAVVSPPGGHLVEARRPPPRRRASHRTPPRMPRMRRAQRMLCRARQGAVPMFVLTFFKRLVNFWQL